MYGDSQPSWRQSQSPNIIMIGEKVFVTENNMMPNINTNVPNIIIGGEAADMIIADAPFITAKQQNNPAHSWFQFWVQNR